MRICVNPPNLPYMSAFPYYGGKTRHLRRIKPLLPEHEVFMDLYCGSGAVLLNRPRSQTEIMNDKNPDIARFFRLMAGKESDELINKILAVEYSREAFNKAKAAANSGFKFVTSETDKAAATYTLLSQSFNACMKQWSNSGSRFYKAKTALNLRRIQERMQGVTVLNKDATELLTETDRDAETMVFLDPPYLHNTRVSVDSYAVETTRKEHMALLERIKKSKKKIMLCGYHSHNRYDLYDSVLLPEGWKHYKLCSVAKSSSSAKEKPVAEEFIWVNYELPPVAARIIDLGSVNCFITK